MEYAIGTQYLDRANRLCRVTDIHKTYSTLSGELVKTRYVSVHTMMGQTVTDHDVVATSIAIGIDRLQKSRAKVA